MTLRGIDISYAQVTTPSLSGLDFVFVRAGYGSDNIDSAWSQHSTRVRNTGKVLGAYWFWYLGEDTAKAVATFLATAGSADLLALDLEGAGHDSTQGHAEAESFIARVHAAGRKIGLYHSASAFPKLGQDFDWIANWGAATAPAGAEFWQYRGSPLDLDYFEGDLAALRKLIGASQAGTGALEQMALYVKEARDGTWRVAPDKIAHGLAPSEFGFVQTGKNLSSGSGTFDAHLALEKGTGPASLIRIVNGALAGLYVSTAEVDEVYTPAPALDCTAAVKAATDPLKARIATIKAKVAAAATDISND